MAYPIDYQDAEHRRALSALMADLESVVADDATGFEADDADHTEPVRRLDSGRADEAEVRIMATRLVETELSHESKN